jgi:hypothetical protein
VDGDADQLSPLNRQSAHNLWHRDVAAACSELRYGCMFPDKLGLPQRAAGPPVEVAAAARAAEALHVVSVTSAAPTASASVMPHGLDPNSLESGVRLM